MAFDFPLADAFYEFVCEDNPDDKRRLGLGVAKQLNDLLRVLNGNAPEGDGWISVGDLTNEQQADLDRLLTQGKNKQN